MSELGETGERGPDWKNEGEVIEEIGVTRNPVINREQTTTFLVKHK